MFNELAFIDWIALAFAAVLLAGAAAAAVLAYATSRARTSEPRSGYAHAASTATTAEATLEREPVHAAGVAASTADVAQDHRPIHAAAEAPQHVADPIQGRSGNGSSVFSEGESIPLGPAVKTCTGEDGDEGREVVEDGAGVMVLDEPAAEVAEIEDGETDENVIDLRTAMPMPAVNEVDESELAAKLASRAAKLRGRPIAEKPKPEEALASRKIGMAPGEVSAAAPQAEQTPSPRIGFGVRVPGFFEDPMGRHELRYWDGNRWTEYVKERGERFTDPL